MHIFDITFRDITGEKAQRPHTMRYFRPATLVKGIQYCSRRKFPDRLQAWWLSHAHELSWEHWHINERIGPGRSLCRGVCEE